MAISQTHYQLLKLLRERGELPQGGRILELGKANLYGDISTDELRKDIDLIEDSEKRDYFRAALNAIFVDGPTYQAWLFLMARYVYQAFFNYEAVVSIDLDPMADGALRLDLNTASWADVGAERQVDVSFNHGTLEHIANDTNGFRLMHDATQTGGLMIHEAPFTGWIDHGMRNYQPTYFYDLAHDNGYEIVFIALEHLASRTAIVVESREQVHEMKRRDQLADNLMLFVAMRKGQDAPYNIPMQGVYAGTVSKETAQAWRELR